MDWRDPPLSTGRRSNATDQIVAELKQHPGRWALVDHGSTNLATKWRARGCEVVYRRNGDNVNRVDIYARWPEEAT